MRYRVRVQPAALADAEEYVAFIRDRKTEPLAAARWYDGLVEAILSLGSMPERCPVIPEQDNFKIELRHCHYHSHRIILHIDEGAGTVEILRVYHSARDALQSELSEAP